MSSHAFMSEDRGRPAPRGDVRRPARRVGPYALVARLGAGGMASVYLGTSTPHAPRAGAAAVKVLHPHLADDARFVAMFLQEARLAAAARHPNVVSVRDAGRDGGVLYAALDYVEGDTLAAIQATAASLWRALPLGLVLRVVLDVLAGLHFVHELRDASGEALHVVHRDVTPHNVLVGVDGVARLTDFGIARARGGDHTEHGVIKGKLPYMAPEQLDGRAVDRRADLFALGVTLWEALALRRLLPGRATEAMARRDPRAPYRSLLHARPSLPPALDDVCRRALADDPAERFATAAEFAEALERAAPGAVASRRELGGLVAALAHERLEREREALRAARPPAPPPHAPTLPPAPAPRAPTRRPRRRLTPLRMRLQRSGAPDETTAPTVSRATPVGGLRARTMALAAFAVVAGAIAWMTAHGEWPSSLRHGAAVTPH